MLEYSVSISPSSCIANAHNELYAFCFLLVHSFVTSRVDCCNSVLASAPKVIDKLQLRVQNAAARLITGTQKHERGRSRLLRDDLHWLTISQRVQYEIAVHRCLTYLTPIF